MWTVTLIAAPLVLLAAYDLLQRKHAILRNFPLVGHLRYILEAIGPELRQYIVTGNDEERPFSRDQRRWVYASSKGENNTFGFGTDNDLEHSANYLIIKHRTLGPQAAQPEPDPQWALPCAKILGEARDRRSAFRPRSVVNVSGMSFGSLSAAAIEALNRGSQLAGCLHNTGEGGVSPHHLHGGDLTWQVGTGYFGCRDRDGGFDLEELVRISAQHPVRAIEIKLSQGAKPGLGGLLPGAKVTEEIARIRGIPVGEDCHSPPSHSAFRDLEGLLALCERIADATGLPVGIKSAVGEIAFWEELALAMQGGSRGVDFITIDGGEGGTGAAPLTFADHVALPFKLGFTRVYKIFARRRLHERIVFIGSGKLGFPETGLLACSLGCDLLNVGREAMMAVGCIQAQRCHTGHCPTGVATQNAWLMRGLDPTEKAARLAGYVVALRRELTRLSRACGVPHPALVTSDVFEVLDDRFGSRTPRDLFGYEPGWELPSAADRAAILGPGA